MTQKKGKNEPSPSVPKTKVGVKKKLSVVQTCALQAVRKEFNSMISEVAKEVGIDTDSNEIWALSDDCTFFIYQGLQPIKKGFKEEKDGD